MQGDRNASTLTYNVGGAAAGIDYRFDPRFLVGLGVGYTHGTQWVNGFLGQGWTDTVSVAAYGSFTQGAFYVDMLAGYAYSSNQLQRQIVIPGLQPRTANGSAGANQFLGQVEVGYKVPVYAPAAASVTPFARLQVMSVNQNGLLEWGANSLSLNVPQQGTNSLRSTFGADIAGAIGARQREQPRHGATAGLAARVSPTRAGRSRLRSPARRRRFTVYGATPQRDAAVIGFPASTAVADDASIYLRYDGDIGSRHRQPRA